MDSTPTADRYADPELCATVGEMGFQVSQDGDGLIGRATLYPELDLPGTDRLRMSVLATWGDTLTGVLAGLTFKPRIGVTLDLDLHLYRAPVGGTELVGRSRLVRAGRSVVVTEAEFELDGEPLALCRASFVASPNPDHVMPEGLGVVGRPVTRRLRVPLADRAGIRRVGDGAFEIPLVIHNQNPTGAIQGGLLTLAVEEAVLDAAPDRTIDSCSIRYLRGFRQGPARATARVHGGVADVHLVDPGTGTLGAVAVARLSPR